MGNPVAQEETPMFKPLTIACAGLSLAFASPASAQDTDVHAADAIATVSAFMSAFDAQDADAMLPYLADGAVVAFVQEMAEDDRVGFVPMGQLVQGIGSSTADLQEPIWNLRGFEDGPVAVVTANFEFLVDGNRSHCGVNIFTLMRIEGEWKIATVTYSHITEGCGTN